MTDREHESLAEDEEVEITDLDRPGVPQRPRVLRMTPRQRRASLVLTLALFVLVIGVILTSTAGFRTLLGEGLFRASSPTPAGGDLAFYLRGNPSWGQFTIDGKTLSQVPRLGRDEPLTLAPGRHTIIWRLVPFNVRTCNFTVVNASTVSGPCFRSSDVTASFIPNVSAMILSFFSSLNDLPANQRASLTQQVQAQLALAGGSETIYPGEFYAISKRVSQAASSPCKLVNSLSLCYARANAQLKATLSLQLDTSTSRDDPCAVSGPCDINSQDCRAFCENPGIYANQQRDGWNVDAVVYIRWSYYTPSGRLVAADQPDSAIGGSPTNQLASLHLDWSADQTWHIVLFPSYAPGLSSSDPLCAQAVNDLAGLLNDVSANMYVNQAHDDYRQEAAGCLTIASVPPLDVDVTPTPMPATNAPSSIYVLHRFGVMLAANDATHKLCPYLPMVDAREKSVAQRLLIDLSPST